jgi:AcrR family transcriptional regulator
MSDQAAPHRSSDRRRSPGARPTDDELLDAARAVFAERGFKQSTMEAIAERANSTKPTLYAHFGGKEKLYRASFTREAETLRQWVVQRYSAAAGLSVPERVRGYVMALFDFAQANPDSFRMIFDVAAADEPAPTHQELITLIEARVAEQIEQALVEIGRTPGPSTGLLAAMMVSLCGAAARHALHHSISPSAAGELASGFITAAITTLDPGLLDAVDR